MTQALYAHMNNKIKKERILKPMSAIRKIPQSQRNSPNFQFLSVLVIICKPSMGKQVFSANLGVNSKYRTRGNQPILGHAV
jgi:hypothetical protein